MEMEKELTKRDLILRIKYLESELARVRDAHNLERDRWGKEIARLERKLYWRPLTDYLKGTTLLAVGLLVGGVGGLLAYFPLLVSGHTYLLSIGKFVAGMLLE